MPKVNKTPIQRKSINISIGVNNSNKAQLNKISKLKKTLKPLPQVPLVELYMRVDKTWQHKGISCGICGVLVNHPEVIEKHRYVCKGKKNIDEE